MKNVIVMRLLKGYTNIRYIDYLLHIHILHTTLLLQVSLLKSFLLTKFPGIVSVHEFHVWTLTPGCLVLTGHLTYASQDQYHMIHDQVLQKTTSPRAQSFIVWI